MIVNLEFFISDIAGREYQVICVVDCSGQAADLSCDNSDTDCYGWFCVDEVTYVLIDTCDDDCEMVELSFDDCTPDLQSKITAKVEELAEYDYNNPKDL